MHTVARNTLYNLFGQGLALVVTALAVRYTYRELGQDIVGIIYLATTLAAFAVTFLDIGMSSVTIREVSSWSSTRPGYVVDVARTAGLIYWSLFVALGITFWLTAPLVINRWIHPSSLDVAGATLLLRTAGIGLLSVLPRSLYLSLLRGFERMDLSNALDLGSNLLLQVGIAAILLTKASVAPLALWFVIWAAAAVMAHGLLTTRVLPYQALVPGFVRQVVDQNIKFSSAASLISIFAAINTYLDKLVLSRYAPLGQFGYYGFIYAMLARALLPAAALFNAIFPAFSRMYRQGEQQQLARDAGKLQELLVVLILPVFAAFPFFADPLLRFIFDAEAARILRTPVLLLSVGFYMNATLNIPYAVSLAAGRADIGARMNALAFVVIAPATVALVRVYGLTGGALAWATYHLLAYAYAIPKIWRLIDTPPRSFYGQLGRTVAFALGTYGPALAGLRLLSSGSLLVGFAAYAAATIAFLSGSFLLLRPDTRSTLAQFPRWLASGLTRPV